MKKSNEIFASADFPVIVARSKNSREDTRVRTFNCKDSGVAVISNYMANPYSPITGGKLVPQDKKLLTLTASEIDKLEKLGVCPNCGAELRAHASVANNLGNAKFHCVVCGEELIVEESGDPEGFLDKLADNYDTVEDRMNPAQEDQTTQMIDKESDVVTAEEEVPAEEPVAEETIEEVVEAPEEEVVESECAPNKEDTTPSTDQTTQMENVEADVTETLPDSAANDPETTQMEPVEAETNPLETNSVDLSYDERYTQAIMKAVASESEAIVEYEQILALEPNVSKESLVNLFHDTLIDIKNEEIKHFAQLNTQLSKDPSLKNSYERGKEEANSGVDKSSEEKQEESVYNKEESGCNKGKEESVCNKGKVESGEEPCEDFASDPEVEEPKDEEIRVDMLSRCQAGLNTKKIEVVSSGKDTFYYVMVANKPVATLHRSRAIAEVQDIFDNKNLLTQALVASIEKDGINKTTLSNFGLVPMVLKVKASEAVQKAVDDKVAEMTTQMELASDQLEEDYQQSLGIAAVAVNKNLFDDTKNVLAEDLIDNLEGIGVEDAREIVESSFKKCGEEYLRTIVAKAHEFKNKSAEVRNELANTVIASNFKSGKINMEHKAIASVKESLDQEEVAKYRSLFKR